MIQTKEFFPPRPSTNPTIYAYELVGVAMHKGLLKILKDADSNHKCHE